MPIRLHVGLPKCASSWLQRQVIPATGLAFGVPFWERTPAADPVLSAAVDLLSGDDPLSTRQRGLVRRLAPDEDVLLSSEVMAAGAWRRPDHLPVDARLERILEATEGSDGISVLVVVRRDGDRLLQSLYSQYVKVGGTRPPAAFLTEVANSELGDPAGIADRVRAAFPRTTVLHLEDLIASPEDFTRDLGTWLGSEVDPGLASMKENVAMTGARLTMARTVNRLADSSVFGERGIAPARPLWFRTVLALTRGKLVRHLAQWRPHVR